MNSLRGIFPEPKTVPKRNFIRENMMQIKQIQGNLHGSSESKLSNHRKDRGHTICAYSIAGKNAKQQSTVNGPIISKLSKTLSTKSEKNNLTDEMPVNIELESVINASGDAGKNLKSRTHTLGNKVKKVSQPHHKLIVNESYPMTEIERETSPKRNNLKEIGIQTESWDETKDIIRVSTKQKSPVKDRKSQKSKSKSPNKDSSKDQPTLIQDIPNEKKNTNSDNISNNIPMSYQKGVVPKYLRDRKEEILKKNKLLQVNDKCPKGHIILPEEERKETLRMLRQSYAAQITELNLLPVKSDTLKTRNRKIEIENQLKKLEEGIKVFTRPKVFVKVEV